MTRHIKRGGRIWIRMFPDKPISKKPTEVRMGNGKGNVEYWVAEIQPGKVLYEMEGVDEALAREAFRLAAAKLPLPTTFVRASSRPITGVKNESNGTPRQGRRRALQQELNELLKEQFGLRMQGDAAADQHRASSEGAPRDRARARPCSSQEGSARHERHH